MSDMKKSKSAFNARDTLCYSAFLVEKLGKAKLPNGKTLAEALTVEGIPFWDVFSAEFAHSHVSRVLVSDAVSENIIHRIKPRLVLLRHRIRDFVQHRCNTHGCSAWPTGKTILCLGFTQQMYRDVLHPVVARLAIRNDCNVVVLSDQLLPDIKPSSIENCKYQSIWQHWDKQVGAQVSKLQRSIRQTDVKEQSSAVLQQIIPAKDLHLLANFKNLFNWFFCSALPHILQYAVLARHILENHRPSLVIASDTADPRARVYSVLCRLMGIPYLDIQFGLTGDEAVEWRFLVADRVAVWGDTSKEAILKQMVSKERISVTGSPRHDHLVNTPESEVKFKRTMLGVPKNSAMVVMASVFCFKGYEKYSDPRILRSMQRAVFEAAAKIPNIFLVVKPHPSENAQETQALLGKSRNVIFVERQSDIGELIKACDAFVSFGSTATVDALIANKLTICPIFPGWAFSDVFKNSGATLVPKSSEEIVDIFKVVANNSHHGLKDSLESARQVFLRRHIYRADGMAAARIEALAVKMAGIEKYE